VWKRNKGGRKRREQGGNDGDAKRNRNKPGGRIKGKIGGRRLNHGANKVWGATRKDYRKNARTEKIQRGRRKIGHKKRTKMRNAEQKAITAEVNQQTGKMVQKILKITPWWGPRDSNEQRFEIGQKGLRMTCVKKVVSLYKAVVVSPA